MSRSGRAMLAVSIAACVVLPGVAHGADGVARLQGSGGARPVEAAPARTFDADHARRLEVERQLGSLSAQAVTVDVDEVVAYDDVYGYRYVDGLVSIPGPGNVMNVLVILQYLDVSDAVIGYDAVWADCWVLTPPLEATFSLPYEPPPGTDDYQVVALADPATASRLGGMSAAWGPLNSATNGERWWTLTITNTNPFTVVGAGASAYEKRDPTGTNTFVFWNTLLPVAAYQQRLAAGESVAVEFHGFRPPPTDPDWEVTAYTEAVPAPPTDPIFRFYNRRTGTHFYTVDPGERDYVIMNLGGLYNYEGPAYEAYAQDQINTTPLYRFFNKRTGTHFYTADEGEKNNTIANLGWLYNYEGPAYFICDSGGLATQEVYRFYNRGNGVHFYTATTYERDQVIAGLSWLYNYEGPAFNAPIPN